MDLSITHNRHTFRNEILFCDWEALTEAIYALKWAHLPPFGHFGEPGDAGWFVFRIAVQFHLTPNLFTIPYNLLPCLLALHFFVTIGFARPSFSFFRNSVNASLPGS